jgi:outer membrane protein insertion porin family/translocation and assembly module TamA
MPDLRHARAALRAWSVPCLCAGSVSVPTSSRVRPGVLARAHAIVLLAASAGCKTIPDGRSAVDTVVVRGSARLDDSDVLDKISTTASPKLLGLFRGVVYEYAIFDRFVLQRDLARVEAFYRAKGYWDAHARAGRVFTSAEKHVRVEIVVEEGAAVLVRSSRVMGLGDVASRNPRAAATARDAALRGIPAGRPFEQEAFTRTETAVRRALSDRGHAWATVKGDAAVDLVAHAADVVFTARAGPRAVFGPVTIEGLGQLPEAPVRRALDLDLGKPYSEAELEAAQQALLDLGVFAAVRIEPALGDGPPASRGDAERVPVPIHVVVEPSRLKAIRVGGGLEFDALKTDLHGLLGWENRNLFGGLRSFAVTFRPGVVLYPLRVNALTAPDRLLPEERLRVDLRQPGFLEARTNLFARPELNVYPVLLDPNPPPGANVLGYGEARSAIGLDRTLWHFFGAVSHNLQVAYPFSYLGPRDPTLELVVVSYPELLTQLDLRNDPVHPRRGIFVGNALQVAGGVFGGSAADVKIQPELRTYVPVTKRLVFAARGTLGFLWPRNYGSVIRLPPSTFDTSPSAASTRDFQLTFFRGFFSGGPTSNRGYPLRGVGPHAVVPFLTPEQEAARLNLACGVSCLSPTGGFTLWESSVELRYDLDGPLSFASFCDASDVSPRTNDVRLRHLHLACGAGARYDTPVGPVRLDVGYRIPGMQVLGGLTADEKAPDTFAFGIPIALSLGIGEAF